MRKKIGERARNFLRIAAFFVFGLVGAASAADEGDDILLMTLPSVAATLVPCSASDVTLCRNPSFCEAAGGIHFQGSCRAKCTSANVTSCVVKTTCKAAGGIYYQESCRRKTGVLGQLASMEGTWRFSSSIGTDVFYFDFDDVEPNDVAQFVIIGDKKDSSFDGFLIYNPNIREFELLEISSLGHTFDYRQFSLNSDTRGSGLHGLSVDSSFGFNMSVTRLSPGKAF